jgi:hypothetical protein
MLRYLFLPPLVAVAFVSVASAQQQRRREDLLDSVTRHIQLCADISEPQMRLSCYDKLPTQLGDSAAAQPSPTPLRPGQAPAGQPLTPPNLQVPGGGPAQLGPPGNQVQAQGLPPAKTGMPANPRRIPIARLKVCNPARSPSCAAPDRGRSRTSPRLSRW